MAQKKKRNWFDVVLDEMLYYVNLAGNKENSEHAVFMIKQYCVIFLSSSIPAEFHQKVSERLDEFSDKVDPTLNRKAWGSLRYTRQNLSE